MREYKVFVKRIGLTGFTNLLISLSGIVLLPILTKNLPIEEYGIWVQITVTIGLIPLVVTLGLPYSMDRFLAARKKKEEIQEGFYSIVFVSLFTSAIASLLLFLLANPLATILFNGYVTISKILCLIIFIECLNVLLLSFFRTFQHIKRYSMFTFIKTWLNVVLVTYFVLSGYGIFGAVIGFLISSIFVVLAMTSLIILEIGIKIPKFTHIKDYLSFSIPTIPGGLSSWIVNSSDRYIIGIFLGASFVGYYSPGYTLGAIISMFMFPFSLMLPAVLSKYYDEDNIDEVKIILKYSLKYFLLLAIPSTFGISFLSKPLLLLLSTPEISSQGYLITPFVALSTLLYGVFVIIAKILYLEKKTKIIGSIWVIAAVLNIGLNLLVLPFIGILGAAITTLISFSIAVLLTIHYSFKCFKFDLGFGFIGKSVLSSIIMSLVIIKLNPIGLLDIITVIIVSVAVYGLILLLLKGFKMTEIQFFKNLLKL
jgi:O-antigen/teichoic acid export membrane protein